MQTPIYIRLLVVYVVFLVGSACGRTAMSEEMKTIVAHSERINSMAYSEKLGMLVSGDFVGHIAFWNVTDQKEFGRLRLLHDSVNAVCFSPDSKVLAVVANHEKNLAIWDPTKRSLVKKVEAHEYSANDVAFSPDGAVVASCGSDGLLKCWDTKSFKMTIKIKVCNPSLSTVNHVQFCSGGKRIVCATYDEVTVWDSESGRKLYTIPRPGDAWIDAMDVLSSRSLVAIGYLDNTAEIWSLKDRKKIATLKKHKEWTTAVKFSPDGKLLATGDFQGNIFLWNVGSWKLHQQITSPHKSSISSFEFCNDTLASGDGNGVIGLTNLGGTKSRRTKTETLRISP